MSSSPVSDADEPHTGAGRDSDTSKEERFLHALSGYRHDDTFSDFAITCKGTIFRVHRVIISAQSAFFRKLCKSDFREACEQTVNLDDDPLIAVSLMVDYFYTLDYSNDLQHPNHADKDAPLYWNPRSMVHAQVFVLADKYDLPGLRHLAYDRFRTKIYEGAMAYFFPDCRREAEEVTEAVRYIFDFAPMHDSRLIFGTIDAFILHEMIVECAVPKIRGFYAVAFDTLLAKVPLFADDLHAVFKSLTVGERILVAEGDARTAILRGKTTIAEGLKNASWRWQSYLEASRQRIRCWAHRGQEIRHVPDSLVGGDRAVDDHPSGQGTDDDSDNWTRDVMDADVLAMQEHSGHDVKAEVIEEDDPPRGLYLLDE